MSSATRFLQTPQVSTFSDLNSSTEKRNVPSEFDSPKSVKKRKGLSEDEVEFTATDSKLSLFCDESLEEDFDVPVVPEPNGPLYEWKRKLEQKKQQLLCAFASNVKYSGEDWLYLLGARDFSTADKCIVRYLDELRNAEAWKAIEKTPVGDFFRQASKPITENVKAFRSKYKDCFAKINRGYSAIIRLCESCIKKPEEIAVLKGRIKAQSLYITKLQKIMDADFELVTSLFQESGSKYQKIRTMKAQIKDEVSTEVVLVDLLGNNHFTLSKNGPEFTSAIEVWDSFKKFEERSLDEMQFYLQKNLTAIALMKPLFAEGLECIA